MSEKRKKELMWGNVQNIVVEEEGRSDAEEEEDANETMAANEYLCHANDIMDLKLVRSERDIQDDSTTFHPAFTHQVFGQDEQIVGYKNLNLKLYYNASTLHTYLGMHHEGPMVPTNASTPLDKLVKEKVNWNNSEQVPIGHSYTRVLEEFILHLDDKFTPPGVQVHAYSTDDGRFFEVYKGTLEDPAIRKYHERLQPFTLWYIDASWYIDTSDHKWEIYFLFENYKDDTNRTKHAICGFSTVYPFYAYPENVRYKISQFLILPPFQRQGHGMRLMQTIYNNKPSNTLEVCVEDPTDELQTMRDRLDLQIFRKFVDSQSDLRARELEWSPDFCTRAHQETKLNKGQIRRCYEIYKLERIKARAPSSEGDTAEKEKRYRLEVKKRLFNVYDLYTAIEDAEERKSKLQEIYDLTVADYMDVLTH